MSSATVALDSKMASAPISEKPASGGTVATGIPTEHDVWQRARPIVASKTWTNSLLAHLPAAAQEIEDRATTPSAATLLASPGFGSTVERLRELRADDDERDRPSDEAFDRTIGILRNVAKKVGLIFPAGVAATGPGRSVRLLWANGEKELRVVIGGISQNRSYIYWRDSGGSVVHSKIDSLRIVKYLIRIS